MVIKIKKLHKDSIIPSYSKEGDAGMDLTAISKTFDSDGNVVYDTGLAFAIPEGYVGLLFPRSSNAKKDLVLTNSVGVLDSGFRGSVMFKYKPIDSLAHSEDPDEEVEAVDVTEDFIVKMYEVGDRVGQIIILPYPSIEFEQVDELTETNRGEGGFGSTGA
jgi:dUTP pyrophosphatase